MIQKLFHTIIHLRLIQIHFQLWYRFRKLWRTNTGFKYSLSIPKEGNLLTFSPWIEKQEVLKGNTFTFLNKSLSFQSNNINWNFEGYGKLWIYNLNYFDFLIQKEMNLEKGLFFIKDFIFEQNNLIWKNIVTLNQINTIQQTIENDFVVHGTEFKMCTVV